MLDLTGVHAKVDSEGDRLNRKRAVGTAVHELELFRWARLPEIAVDYSSTVHTEIDVRKDRRLNRVIAIAIGFESEFFP